MRAVILAGGVGARLRPYTTVLPKPLMPVGNFPIAEILVRQLAHCGITEITFAVGHLHHLIEAYFGNGSRWQVKIDYLHESQPLGTAGPLTQLKSFDEPIIVLNGDILTDLDYRALYHSHLDTRCDITIATYNREVKIDLGVVLSDDTRRVTDYIEKPQYFFQVSMGVYVFSPEVLNFIPVNERFDFPELVKSLIARSRTVRVFPFEGIWLDIGRADDYLNASEVFECNHDKLLPHSLPVAPSTVPLSQSGIL